MYLPGNSEHWSGRVDSISDLDQFRFHQVVRCTDLNEMDGVEEIVLIGFESDEGVRRNNGRVGAAEGPDYFRSAIGNLCWQADEPGFLDVGNIFVEAENLEDAQAELGNAIQLMLSKNKTPFVIGGGHETAFGHFQGVLAYLHKIDKNSRIGILNIDAHFDLRPHNGISHSGSPFLQAHELARATGADLKYFVYGINPFNNTKTLFNKAEELGVGFCTNQEIFEEEDKSLEKLEAFIKSRTHIYLTVCLDVFEASIAPGVSAPAWNGIQFRHAKKVIELAKASGKLLSMDVCELNPGFDQDNRTARLAGMLFCELIKNESFREGSSM
ncbi:MAG: formimidoylglutamase [Balneolales bacterium]|nr:formimidoylglutamase [Balneolales bacterium]